MVVLNDRIEQENRYNKYLANVNPEKNIGITFRVIEGECKIEVFDGNKVLASHTLNTTDDYRDISIKSSELPGNIPEK